MLYNMLYILATACNKTVNVILHMLYSICYITSN